MRRKREQGSAIVLAIFFLTVLFLLARAYQVLIPTELNAALRFKTDTTAYFVADAAIQDTEAWAENELQNGREPSTAISPTVQRTGTLGAWGWTAVVDPDPQTPPLGNNSLRVYRIAATASLSGRAYRRITTWVAQQSFAKFVIYNDRVPAGSFIPVNIEHYDGPFHTNDALSLQVPSGFYSSGDPPAFTSTVTSASVVPGSADGIGYEGGGGPPYDASGNPRPGYYEKIYKQGRNSLRTGVRRIEMPPNSASLANAAWGDSNGLPSGKGVHVKVGEGNSAAGGVYVVGTVDAMTLAADGAGNRSVKITQGAKQTTVTETLGGSVTAPGGQVVPRGKTLIVTTPGNQVTILDSTTNGVVFSTGSISSLSGVNKGPRTIAADISAGSEIVIGGSITRSDTTPGQAPTGPGDNLGIVARQVRIPTSIPRNMSNPLYMYAAMIGGVPGGAGGFKVDEYDNPYRGLGSLRVFGSMSFSHQDVNGTVTSSGQLMSGFDLQVRYDANLALTPPPYFPSFPKLTVRSWKEEPLGP